MSNTTPTPTTTQLETLQSLIDAEKSYLDNLQLIDSKLSPLWMKQLQSVAPDFSELLKCIQDIISVNKPFYDKLISTRLESTECDLGDTLKQLMSAIKLPYLAFSENYINNLNQRQDILCTPSIQQFLNDIGKEKEITLEILFSAPLQQIHFYKSLFNKPHTSIDQSILVQANQLFNSLMIKNSLPPVNLDPSFHTKINCSSVVDVLSDTPIQNYQLSKLDKILLCDTFNCTELSKRVQLILTINHLVFCCPEKNDLLYPPIDINDISIRTIQIDRELLGEYHIQLWISQHRLFTFTAKSKQERNTWLGLDINSNVKKADTVAVSWTPLLAIVEKYDIRRQSRAPAKSIRTQDIFTFYTDQTGEISPLVSSDEEEEDSENDQDIDEKQEESAADKSSSSSLSSSSSMAATTPPAPPPKESLIIPQLPLQPPPKDQHRPLVVSGTKSLPVRNHSLRQSPPIPSNMLSPDVTARAPDTPMPVRPPNVRSVSAQPPQPIIESSSTTPSATSSTSSSSSSSVSNGNTKKPSFMRSVMAAVSNRSSLRHSKSNLKPSIDSVLSSSTPNLKSPPSKNAMQNMSTVSLDQQTLKRPTDPALMRRYSAANLSTDQHQQQQQQPPLPPQHLTIPSHQQQQSPFGQRSSFINNHSTPSFASSQSSLALTPPLSRSSSPGSMTPVGLSRYQTPSSSSSEDLGSPPESPDILLQHGNTIKSVLYSNQQSQVFHWKDESWYAVQEDCSVEVRQTYSNRSCVAIHMKKTGQLYLNAWVLPDTFICRTTETDLSLSLHITSSQSELENYLIHCESKLEADRLTSILEQMHQESIKMNMVISATSTLRGAPPLLMRTTSLAANNTLTPEELQKTFKLAMQCKCKLFVQSASSKWNSFGSVYMKVSQQYTTKKMHIAMESHKGGKVTQLVSAMVQSRNVERLSPKRISFLMIDELEKNSVVYMIQVREETTGDKIFEYIKTKNSENGW
ncbi:unnamed protein product [Mucor circinelloides]|uniref:DH domain-containing protein n=1 Tax=Mucor circinelloides f. circinelloides (strain 1006PhL) TaxID=1220926 RepID=S2K7P5_MUCC1|nr:hypothetical protein HMPREF1544_01719 [Mucor circinelloides 1006PhL]